MVTRLTFENAASLFGPLFQLRELFLVERPRTGSPSHEELAKLIQAGEVVAVLSSSGYLLCHQGLWQGKPVLFLDEVFLHPQARKQGHLKELIEWLQGYCLFNGLTTCLLNTFSVEEARPMQAHLGATSISILMSFPIPTDRPLYQSTYHPPILSQPPEKKKRKSKTPAPVVTVVPAETLVTERPLTPPSWSEDHAVLKKAGIQVPDHAVVRDGLVLPADPERM